MTLQLPANRLPQQATETFSIGIRPQNVLFITKTKYESYPTLLEPTAKITFPNPADRPLAAKSSAAKPSADRPSVRPPLLTNQAYCWPTHHWPLPDKINLFVKLHTPSESFTDYHLQATLSHETWHQLQQQPLPWTVYLPSQHLIVLRP